MILGAGGLARELFFHARESGPFDEFLFVDDVTGRTEIDLAGKKFRVVKDWRFPRFDNSSSGFVVGVGAPAAKRLLVGRALEAGLRPLPTLVHPRALVQDPACALGRGGLVAPGALMTTNIALGDYVTINLGVTIGHDARIGDYVNVSPGCSISGNVVLGHGVDLGTGTTIREKLVLADGVVTGALSCVVKSVAKEGCTVVGVPARELVRP